MHSYLSLPFALWIHDFESNTHTMREVVSRVVRDGTEKGPSSPSDYNSRFDESGKPFERVSCTIGGTPSYLSNSNVLSGKESLHKRTS
jgi:hypothetical protein